MVCAVALHHIEVEEENNQQQRDDGTDGDNLHRDVPLCAFSHWLPRWTYLPFPLAASPTAPLMMPQDLIMPMIPAMANATDTDALGIVFEDFFRP